MKKTITMMSEEFENESTGEKVEGITVIVDGIFKEFLDVIKMKQPNYKNNVSVLQDALMKGLEEIRKSL
ncbi:MAG: hypothetical protein HFE58_07740 [Firmicutes bacterium]|jgi:hypothetical protein|nr:hypothetical protein [Bacillota bacterium]